MRTPFPRTHLLVLIALASVAARAQMVSGPGDYKHDPRVRQVAEATARSDKLVDKARDRLRKGRLAEARGFAVAAVGEGDAVGYPMLSALVMLADIDLRLGDPASALRALNEFDGTSGYSDYTKAIALARLGRRSEARAILVEAVGDADSGAGYRGGAKAEVHWRLPMDDADTASALDATALFLRSASVGGDDHEVLNDLRAAARLAPSYGVIHYWLAYQLEGRNRYDEALAEYQRAAQLGNSEVRRSLKGVITHIRGRIAAQNATTANGKTPR